MKVAVVILNWNGKKLLKEYLPDVVQYSPESDVYIVDNASTDDSIDYINENFPSVKCIKLDDNYGYAGGYNRAVQQIDCPIQILMNSDVRPAENWLQPIINTFENNEEVAALQPKILSEENKAYFEYAGACGGYIDQLGYPFCRGRIFEHIEKDEGQYDDQKQIFWASGACLAIKKKVFKEAGGFDELYFAHQEEIDLCWRINNLGYKIMVQPDSKVYHLGGGTLNEQHPKKTFYNFRNSLFNLLKNAPENRYKKLIFQRMLLDNLSFLYFIILLKWKHAVMVLKAHKEYYKHKKQISSKRNSSKQIQIYYYSKNLVLKHFLFKIKHFNKIN